MRCPGHNEVAERRRRFLQPGTCFTFQTGDMLYTFVGVCWFFSFFVVVVRRECGNPVFGDFQISAAFIWRDHATMRALRADPNQRATAHFLVTPSRDARPVALSLLCRNLFHENEGVLSLNGCLRFAPS